MPKSGATKKSASRTAGSSSDKETPSSTPLKKIKVVGSPPEDLTTIAVSSSSSDPVYEWASFGGGSYNRVWTSTFLKALVDEETYQGPWVLKYPIPADNTVLDAMNDRNRAVRVWNEVNHSLPKAGLYKSGWVAPYIQNARQATDEESAGKTIQIYCESRRIILDAATKGNILTVNDTGEVILVDMDLALNRTKSFASIEFAKNLDKRFASYWVDPTLKKTMPKTLEVTRNLLYLEDNLSSKEIDTLCDSNLLNIANILALTWARTNRKKLTADTFNSIAILTDSGVTLGDVLNEALFMDVTQSMTPPPSQTVKHAAPMMFFTSELPPRPEQKESKKMPLNNLGL